MNVTPRPPRSSQVSFNKIEKESEATEVIPPIAQATTDARNIGAVVSLPAGFATAMVFGPEAGAAVIATVATVAMFSPLTPLALLARHIGQRNAEIADATQYI